MEGQVKETIEKWLKLQKIIKEEITLSEIINEQPDIYISHILDAYYNYYESKLSIRELYENNSMIIDHFSGRELIKFNKFNLIKKPEEYLLESITFIPNILFNLKDNILNLKILIKLFEKSNMDNHNTIVDLICHQFYEDIINPQHEEFLILCASLLNDLIGNMSSSNIYSFLDNTFIDKLLKNYIRKIDFKNYLSMTMKEIILNIENMSDFFMELNSGRIYEYLKAKAKVSNNKSYHDEKKRNLFPIDNENLSKRIRRTTVRRKNDSSNSNSSNNKSSILSFTDKSDKRDSNKYNSINKSSFENTPKSSMSKNINFYESNKKDDLSYLIHKQDDGNRGTDTLELVLEEVDDVKDLARDDLEENNTDYLKDLTHKELNKRQIQSESYALKLFYEFQLCRITTDKDMYTNKKLLHYIASLPDYNDEVLKRFKENYERMKEFLDNILNNLINNVSTIPYSIRCICKLINMLILKKFPKINILERNAFIGEFFFEKCLIFILANPDYNAIVTNTFLTDKTKTILATLGKVIRKVSRSSFFDSGVDWNFTIFNHYFIEIMPSMMEFFDRLIDVELPLAVEDVLNDFNILGKYNYFKYHPEQLIRIDPICYSVKDVILIWKYLYNNIKEFDHDLNLKKAILKYKAQEKFLNELDKKDTVRKFMIAVRDKKKMINPAEIDLFDQKKRRETFATTNIKEQDNTLDRVKNCIKFLLKSLNIIDQRNYTHLSEANTTERFFLSLNEVVKFEEFTEMESGNKIRLNWFSFFLTTYLNSIPQEYQENNFYKLYSEILNQEIKEIEFLKSKSNIVIGSFGMLMRCAEKVIEQVRRDEIKVKKINRFIKIEKFLKTANVKVCVRINKNRDETGPNEEKKNSKVKSSGFFDYVTFWKNKQEEKIEEEEIIVPTIIITSSEECIHKRLQYLNELKEGKLEKINSGRYVKIDCHADTVLDFIKIFGKFHEIKEEIVSGQNIHRVDISLRKYLNIVKEELIKSEFFQDYSEESLYYVLDEIECYIIKKIYRRIYPERESEKDKIFYEETRKLSFVTPENMDIKKDYINEKIWIYAVNELNKMDQEKSPISKINCIINAVETIVNCIRFCTGKYNSGYSLDDYLPILNYIIIKSQPKRFVSNINFMKALLDKNKSMGTYGHNLTNLESAYSYILNINHTHLNMNKDDFDEEILNYKLKRYNLN